MSAVDSLWDDDDVEDVPKRQKTPRVDSDEEDAPRPSKRPRQTLFLLGSDDEDDEPEVATRAGTRSGVPKDLDIDVEGIFKEVVDDDDAMMSKPLGTIDADELERQEQARFRKANPGGLHQIMPSSSPTRGEPGQTSRGGKKGDDDEEKKPKRRPMLLNEGLLLGPTGFPELIKNVKDFKVKGKGHEASDLNRLLSIYQFWTHGLYPKTQFKDTVARVEKLCHSKRMQVALSVWKDEAKGIHHESDSGSEDENMDTGEQATPATRQSSAAPSNASRNSTPPLPVPSSRPPSSASEYDDIFDEDFEALLNAGSAPSNGPSNTVSSSTAPKSNAGNTDSNADDDFWAEMAEMDQDPVPAPNPPSASKGAGQDDDQEMWDLIDEVSPETTAKSGSDIPKPSSAAPPPPPPQYADPSEWDDMYE